MTGQMSHASNPRARKKAREGERRMHAERQQSGQPPMAPEQARARLEEIACWPDPDVPDLVYPLARFMAVRAQRAAARFLATTVPGGPDPDPVMVDALLDKFAALHLLVALRSVPHIASSAARDVVAVWRNGGAAGPLIAKYCRAFGVDPDEVTRLEEVLAGGEGDRRIVSAPGVPDLVAVGNGPLLDPDCRDGKHTSCLGAPCECPVPGVHTTRHEYERSQP